MQHAEGGVEEKKKGIAMVMSGVPREKKQRFRRGANLKKWRAWNYYFNTAKWNSRIEWLIKHLCMSVYVSSKSRWICMLCMSRGGMCVTCSCCVCGRLEICRVLLLSGCCCCWGEDDWEDGGIITCWVGICKNRGNKDGVVEIRIQSDRKDKMDTDIHS